MSKTALLIGNSDGIGLAATRRLLADGWEVTGISRSASPVEEERYTHHVCDVASPEYVELLDELAAANTFDLCIYLAGIGEWMDPKDMSHEVRVVDVNLLGMVRTAAAIVPGMVRAGQGHFIGISSLADELLSTEAPSYHASKAGVSNYLGGLRLALKPMGVAVTNVRFGFVDTKMAKGKVKPFMMSVEKAVDHLEQCIRKRPPVYVAPRAVVPLIKFRKWMIRLAR